MLSYIQPSHPVSSSTTTFHRIQGAEVVIFEGILAFHDPKLVELYDMKVFVDTDDDTRLIRRSMFVVVE